MISSDNPVNLITEAIIGDCITVHRELGPGMFEATYGQCLAILLRQRGLKVDWQVALPAWFRGERLDHAYRIDLLVENKVVVELKTVDALHPAHLAQLNTYLKFSGCKVGLLINFNVTRLKDGIRRVVREYEDEPSQTSQTSAPSAMVVPPRAP